MEKFLFYIKVTIAIAAVMAVVFLKVDYDIKLYKKKFPNTTTFDYFMDDHR